MATALLADRLTADVARVVMLFLPRMDGLQADMDADRASIQRLCRFGRRHWPTSAIDRLIGTMTYMERAFCRATCIGPDNSYHPSDPVQGSSFVFCRCDKGLLMKIGPRTVYMSKQLKKSITKRFEKVVRAMLEPWTASFQYFQNDPFDDDIKVRVDFYCQN